MENRTVSSTSSSFEFSFEEALRQRRASEEIANICGNLQVQIKKLENQLEVSYEDKKKFLCLIDELEVQMEKLHLKYQRDIENEKEKAADFNAEVIVCHKHIEELEEKLKVKNRQIELHYEYMAARAVEKQEMKKRIEELEDQLQLMQVQTMELNTLREENEILKKRNSNLSNLVDCLMVPESTSGEPQEEVCTYCDIKCEDICFGRLAEFLDSQECA